MARFEEVISIFLASPGDVAPERKRFAEVIERWNREWSRNQGVRLELLKWEDHAYPDIGEDAQDVINRQIPTDWDMFVGIMWARFGTPTGRAGSGTKEEFDRALQRYRANPDRVHLLMYFKDTPLAPSKIDPDQLQKVHIFKGEVQEQGLLTCDFSDADNFESLVQLHLTRHVQSIRKASSASEIVLATKAVAVPGEATPPVAQMDGSPPQDDDAGLLDLLEDFSDQSIEVGQIVGRLATAQETLNENLNQGTAELNRLAASTSAQAPASAIRASIASVASEMLTFTACIEDEVPRLHTAFAVNMGTLTKLIGVAAELNPEQLLEMRPSITSLLQNLSSAREGSSNFRDTISSLPRMSKELNLAKRKLIAAMGSLIAEFESGEALLVAGLTALHGLLSGEDGAR